VRCGWCCSTRVWGQCPKRGIDEPRQLTSFTRDKCITPDPRWARTGMETIMARLTRRSLIRDSLGLMAVGAPAPPHIANAQAETAEVGWAQGFVPGEEKGVKKVVADYEKASGNKIDLQITPFAPQRQKIVAAMQTGVVPDLFPNNPGEIIALQAWDDKLVDLTDVIEPQKSEYVETALLNTYC